MSRYDLSREEVAELLSDHPSYRATQLWEGLYRHAAEPSEITVLPRSLRLALSSNPLFLPALSMAHELSADKGETTKWLFRLDDGSAIETVLMHHPRHSTVCVSSQAGCAMACTFCATGQSGFGRHLRAGEIVEQVVVAAKAARSHGRRLDHVVFMGMGEPLANWHPVATAIDRIVGDLGIGARNVTVSTVGIVPGIRRVADLDRQINLAVSLHAANDSLRSELVPINRRYPLSELVAACRDYIEKTHRRISFEWAMIDGVNDRLRDADELATIARTLFAHVNLIPLNPTALGEREGLGGSSPATIRAFRERLTSLGVNVTVRRTRGRAIDAACGQLAGSLSE